MAHKAIPLVFWPFGLLILTLFSVSNNVKIIYEITAKSIFARTFLYDESESWKATKIRGHDIAEMIAQELYDTEALTVPSIRIASPVQFAGDYEIKTAFEPTFTAKRIESTSDIELTNTPSGKRR